MSEAATSERHRRAWSFIATAEAHIAQSSIAEIHHLYARLRAILPGRKAMLELFPKAKLARHGTLQGRSTFSSFTLTVPAAIDVIEVTKLQFSHDWSVTAV